MDPFSSFAVAVDGRTGNIPQLLPEFTSNMEAILNVGNT